ncbi:MAG: 50S ribosomal protein L1 [Bdellovibrionales bacterium]|nr:50S ribosomal protein L1 [Bdellovibrionales bacterium]
MSKKRYKKSLEKVDRNKLYDLEQGLKIAIETATAKFDESIDVAIRLGVDSKQADQQVRGAVTLPHGLGKKVRVLVFAKGEKEEEARKAGADFVGAEDMIEKIKSGWLDFDRVLATPDMMPLVAKVAKILGPKALMPSPKTGAVSLRIGPSVSAEKKGKASFRIDKKSIVHSSIGKKSMGYEKLKANCLSFLEELIKLKPKSSKGSYLRHFSISSTMGPSVIIKTFETQKEFF